MILTIYYFKKIPFIPIKGGFDLRRRFSFCRTT
jgi:hypothetical protein